MKKMIFKALSLMALLFAGSVMVNAQEQMPTPPPMPLDPQCRSGVLENGMTYYVRHNETPKGQADFFIAQKVGSILEEENQRGLAHFLEHMCFNGTTHFPGKGIINWLESIGVKFGQNLNAYTGMEETVYNISQVPVARESVQDSCLLILYDWACDLTLAPEEIDSERGVIHEEWRRSMVGAMRIFENLGPTIYPNNRYGVRLPIGTMDVVDNFEHQALVDYYHTWYRPDNQAIIVVGDIDAERVEAKIKEMFSDIKMPENPKERVYYEIEDTPGTIYAIGTDKEMQAPMSLLMFKNELLIPRELRNTQAYYPVDYMVEMVTRMLNARLSELGQKPDTDYAGADIEIGNFLFANTKAALTLQTVAKGSDIIPGLVESYRELLRAARTGFTVGEYERARTEFLSQIEKLYEGRNDRDNTSYCREYAKLFTENVPAPGIEAEKLIYEQYAQMLPVEAINTILPELMSQDNRVFLAMLPENDAFKVPTEAEVAAALASVEAETLEAYKDEVREDPLIPNLPAPGSLASSTTLPQWDATEYTLSNGVKVIVKPTTFKNNEIVFEALAKGGYSTVDPSQAANVKFLPYASVLARGLNDYTNSDIQKYMQGKQASLTFAPDAYIRALSGTTTVKDLPTLMELIYATFTGMNFKDDDFAASQHMIAGQMANQESTPDFAFSKLLMKDLYASPLRQAMTSADILAADAAGSNALIKPMLANAADYTFVFTGNINMDSFFPLMLQYLATLPADAATATTSFTPDPAFEIEAVNRTQVEKMKMENPQTWVFVGLIGKSEYTPKTRDMADMLGQILSKTLLTKIREEMQAVYSIGAVSRLSRLSQNNFVLQIPFPMKPEMQEQVLEEIHKMVEALPSSITAEELASVKEFMLKDAAESLEKNDEWAEAIINTSINGVDTFNGAADVINSITLEDIKAYAAKMVAEGGYRVILLEPEM